MPQVTYIVPARGKPGVLTACLSTFRQFHPSDPLVVVDRNSPDGEEIRNTCGIYQAQYIRLGADKGIGAAYNRGIAECKTPYVCLINNDIEFTRHITAPIEKAFHDDPLIAIAGALLYYPNEKIQHGGGWWDWNSGTPRHYGRDKWLHESKLCSVPAYRIYVTGALCAIERKFWEEQHKWDEMLKSSPGDSDYCLKVWQSGRRVFYNPEIAAIRHESPVHGGTREEKKRPDPVEFLSQNPVDREFRKRYGDADIHRWDLELNRLNRQLHPELPRAFVRTGALGDVLKVLPIYRFLTETQKPFVVVTFSPEVFKGEQVAALSVSRDEFAVSDFIEMDLAYERRPDLVIDQAYWEAIGRKDHPKSSQPAGYTTDPLDWFRVRASFPNVNWDGPYIVIHAPNEPHKQNKSLHESIWKAILNRFATDATIVNVGAASDYQFAGRNVVNLVNQTSLPMLAAIIQRAALFIGSDSGPAHLADGSCPSIVLATVIDPSHYYSKKAAVIQTKAECRGCLHRVPPPVTNSDCEFMVGDERRYCCTYKFDVGEIVRKAEELLKKDYRLQRS